MGTTEETDASGDTPADEDVREHLREVDDGCGCVEVWEALSDDDD